MEYEILNILKNFGYIGNRQAGSHSDFDIIVQKVDEENRFRIFRFIQSKRGIYPHQAKKIIQEVAEKYKINNTIYEGIPEENWNKRKFKGYYVAIIDYKENSDGFRKAIYYEIIYTLPKKKKPRQNAL